MRYFLSNLLFYVALVLASPLLVFAFLVLLVVERMEMRK